MFVCWDIEWLEVGAFDFYSFKRMSSLCMFVRFVTLICRQGYLLLHLVPYFVMAHR